MLLRLYRLGLHRRGAFALMIVGMILLGATNGMLALVMKALLESFGVTMGGSDVIAQLPPERVDAVINEMKELSYILLAAVIPGAVIAGGTWYVSQHLAGRCMQDLRRRFLGHYLELDMAFHSAAAKGDMIARMSADMEATAGLQRNLYGKLQQRPVEAIGMIVALFYIEPLLAVALFLVLFPVVLVLLRLFKRTKRHASAARKTMAVSLSAFEQAASGIRVIKSLGRAEEITGRYDHINDDLFRKEMKTAGSRAQSDAVSYGVVFLVMALLLLGSVGLIRSQLIEPAVVATFAAALGRMMTLARTTQRSWNEILQNLPAAERIYAVLDREPSIQDDPSADDCPVPKDAIELHGVHFRYSPDADEVLRGLDLRIPIGTTVALVGESGAGKSTILDLLPRFHDVSDGAITIDGRDLRELRYHSLIQHFAIVQQDSFLFNDTVAANIRLGRPDASDADIEQAARRAHVHDAILALEGGLGYATVVGDRGERLSGGQRQRVAIARALLRDAPVLLLDEPTAALDADSEQHVQQALDELLKDRTCVVVAHRLATVQHADCIAVISAETGQVCEQGTHAELLERDGAYARLVRMQQLDS